MSSGLLFNGSIGHCARRFRYPTTRPRAPAAAGRPIKFCKCPHSGNFFVVPLTPRPRFAQRRGTRPCLTADCPSGAFWKEGSADPSQSTALSAIRSPEHLPFSRRASSPCHPPHLRCVHRPTDTTLFFISFASQNYCLRCRGTAHPGSPCASLRYLFFLCVLSRAGRSQGEH